MDKSSLGIAISIAGLFALIEAFKLHSTEKMVYFLVGVALIVGGLFYAPGKK